MFKKIDSENLIWPINGEEPMPAGKKRKKLQKKKKEANEGKAYESGIGLNLELSTIPASKLE